MDVYLFHQGGFLVGAKGRERWFDYSAEALTPTKANLRLLRRAIPRGAGSSVRRVFLFNEYYWLSTDLNVYTVAESQAKDILFKNFVADEGAKRPVGIVSKTTSFFVGRALDAEVLEAIQSLFPRAYVYSGSLALGDYWVSKLLPSAAGGSEAGEKKLALLAVKGTGLVYYGQVGFLELVTALPALGRLSLEKGAQDVARLKEEVVASLTETLSLMAESQPKGVEVFFPETAQALARIGLTVDPSAVHGPLPADFLVPPEYTYAKPTVLVTGRRLNPEYVVALLGVLAYVGSFAYEKAIEARISRASEELALLEARAGRIRQREQLLNKLESEVLILKQALPTVDVLSKRVVFFLDVYAERVPPDYKITRLEYTEGSFRIALSFRQKDLSELVKRLASMGDVEIEGYKRAGDEVEVSLIYRPR